MEIRQIFRSMVRSLLVVVAICLCVCVVGVLSLCFVVWLLVRLASVLKTILHPCVISYTDKQATSTRYDTWMKTRFKDWSQSSSVYEEEGAGGYFV